MDLIVVADCLDSLQPLLRAASRGGHRVLKLVGPNDEVSRHIGALSPDATVIISDEIDSVLLREMKAISDTKPTPVLVFTRDAQPDSIGMAVKAGASAYVVDCNDPDRLSSLLEVARARFDEQQRLKKELLQTRNALQDRKRIEKAKGIIMNSRSLSEDQAYQALRKLAMNRNKRMGEIAEQIISASEVLV